MATWQRTRRAEFVAGVQGIAPLLIGSIPFAIIFGALAVNSGLSPLAAAAMSALVFAGSAQFVGVGMVASGASAWVIILTTFVINLRHVLYGATLAPHLRRLGQRWLLPFGFLLTDESFVVAIQRYNLPDHAPYRHWYQAGATIPLFINWQVFTWIGLWAGSRIPNPGAWGLDFAFPAAFIGMLMPLIISRSIAVCVATSAFTSLLFYNMPNKLGLLVAALCGVAAGMLAEQWLPAAHPVAQEQAAPRAYERADQP